MSARRPASGFTLVEMMIATLIFSMVIAGFAAIYTTAFSQSGAVLRDARLKSIAMISFKNITKKMASATRVDLPLAGASGTAMTGCAQMAPDGDPMGFGSSSAFGFCIQTGTSNGCGTADNPPPCLFMYTWAACPPPALNTGNCGSALGAVEVEMLASKVLVPGPIDPEDDCRTTTSFYTGITDYFTRGGNDVRVAVRLCRPKPLGSKIPLMWYDSSTVAHGHFDSRL
ncbi:MAG: hypothetical protein FD126_410 [Elusimicrobia bacterium]|nr:MAG: hypothetical protein FD126_410 [Elusimicrobiota bacterium]